MSTSASSENRAIRRAANLAGRILRRYNEFTGAEFPESTRMTNDELQKIVEEIGIKVNTLAQLQLTIAATVNEGLRTLLASSDALLQIARNHENRIQGLEN